MILNKYFNDWQNRNPPYNFVKMLVRYRKGLQAYLRREYNPRYGKAGLMIQTVRLNSMEGF